MSVLYLGGRDPCTIYIWSFEVSNMEPGPSEPRLGTFEPGTMEFESLEARPPGLGVLEAGTVELGSLEARPFGLWAMKTGTWELEDVNPGQIGPRDIDLGLGAIELMRAPELTTRVWAMERVLVGRHMANRDICTQEC